MDNLAAKIPLGCGGLIFYPHLRGDQRISLRPRMLLRHHSRSRKSPFHQGLLEGVAFGIYDG